MADETEDQKPAEKTLDQRRADAAIKAAELSAPLDEYLTGLEASAPGDYNPTETLAVREAFKGALMRLERFVTGE